MKLYFFNLENQSDRNMDLLSMSGLPNNEQISLKNALDKHISNVRYCVIFFENNDGQLWIPTVSNFMDVSAIYPIFSGQTPLDAAEDFLKNEMACANKKMNIDFLGDGSPFDGMRIDFFISTFRVCMNEIPNSYTSRFEKSQFIDPQKLFDEIFSGSSCSNLLQKIISSRLYEGRVKKFSMRDLLDFDPEERIFEIAGEYLKTCHDSECLEESRIYAEDILKKNIKIIVEEAKKNFPRESPLFSNIYRSFPKKKGEYFEEPQSEPTYIENDGYFSFNNWPDERKENWLKATSEKYGVPFRKYLFRDSFTCSYSGNHDYKASGFRLESVQLPGREPSEPNRDIASYSNSISVRKKVIKESYSQTIKTTVTIYNTDVLPVEINYWEGDIYSASGFGTSGVSEKRSYIIALDPETGKIK